MRIDYTNTLAKLNDMDNFRNVIEKINNGECSYFEHPFTHGCGRDELNVLYATGIIHVDVEDMGKLSILLDRELDVQEVEWIVTMLKCCVGFSKAEAVVNMINEFGTDAMSEEIADYTIKAVEYNSFIKFNGDVIQLGDATIQ